MRFAVSVGVALYAGLASAHVKPIPLETERILEPNSFTPPKGCKFLAADVGYPSPEKWATLKGSIAKRPGTEGPDYSLIAKTVEDVQAAVNFARENNVRLAIITTGHDFHGRETARSGLSLDMSHFTDITFADKWQCGDVIPPPKKCAEEPKPMKVMDGRLIRRTTGHGPECASFNTIDYQPGVQAVARIGAGVFNQMLTNAGDGSGLFPIGAQHGSVSLIGGWGLAAGHNPFANRYGLGADQILELEVVTADGKFVKASACSNPDLYWGLRGGGGSTYGVVVGGTVKVYPTPKILVTRWFVNSTSDGIYDAMAYFHKESENLLNKYGVQGYYYAYPHSFQGVTFQPDEYATMENAKAAYGPLLAKMEELAGAKHIEPVFYQYKTYKEFYDAEMGEMETEDDDDDDEAMKSQTDQAMNMQTADKKYLSWYDGSDGTIPSADDVEHNPMIVVPYIAESPNPQKRRRRSLSETLIDEVTTIFGKKSKRFTVPKPYKIPEYAQPDLRLVLPTRRTYLDSRLLPREELRTVPLKDLAKAIKETFPTNVVPKVYGPVIRGFMIGGGKLADPGPDGAPGVNPAWRTMMHHFIVNAVVGDARNDYNISAMANLFPKAGAYVNEASPHATEWKDLYWGELYPKHLEIKKKWDPQNIFWCSPCIGADLVTYEDERICPAENSDFGTRAKPMKAPDTLIDFSTTSKIGLQGLPGKDGIGDPIIDWVESTGLTMTDITRGKSDYDPTKDVTNPAYIKPAAPAS